MIRLKKRSKGEIDSDRTVQVMKMKRLPKNPKLKSLTLKAKLTRLSRLGRLAVVLLGNFALTLSLALLFQNCVQSNGFKNNTPDQLKFEPAMNGIFQGTATGNPGQGKISFQTVYNEVFKENCLSCHGSGRATDGIRYDTYEQAIKNGELARLHQSYLQYQEPNRACQSVSRTQMDLVTTWIEQGSPH